MNRKIDGTQTNNLTYLSDKYCLKSTNPMAYQAKPSQNQQPCFFFNSYRCASTGSFSFGVEVASGFCGNAFKHTLMINTITHG